MAPTHFKQEKHPFVLNCTFSCTQKALPPTLDGFLEWYQTEAIHLWQVKIHNRVKTQTTCLQSSKKGWIYPSQMRTKEAADPWNEKCNWITSGCERIKVIDWVITQLWSTEYMMQWEKSNVQNPRTRQKTSNFIEANIIKLKIVLSFHNKEIFIYRFTTDTYIYIFTYFNQSESIWTWELYKWK